MVLMIISFTPNVDLLSESAAVPGVLHLQGLP
jgi:hypothetical protein